MSKEDKYHLKLNLFINVQFSAFGECLYKEELESEMNTRIELSLLQQASWRRGERDRDKE